VAWPSRVCMTQTVFCVELPPGPVVVVFTRATTCGEPGEGVVVEPAGAGDDGRFGLAGGGHGEQVVELAFLSWACPTLLLSTAMVSPCWELEGSVLMVREVRLNVLPAELDVGSSAETVRRLERRSAGEEKLRGLGDEARRAFRIYSYAAFTYVWPRRGWPLPEALQAVETEQVPITDLPAAVTAFAVREAIADHLLLAGFERLPSSLVRPVRLFRRRRNLAHEALGGELQDSTGIFPTAMVQGICLADDEAKPGPVGAVLDIRLLNRLDIQLADLAEAGIELTGTRLVWRHRDGCRCGLDRPEGTAGRMAGGDPRGLVEVARAGATREFPAACLGPQVSRMALEQYFARLRDLNPRQVHTSFDKVTSEFQQPVQQWRFLQFLRSTLDRVTVFAATPMRLGSPVTATVGDPATPATPTILTPLPAPLLNFRHGAPRTERGAAVGLGKHGPYDRDSTDRQAVIQAQILCPKDFHSDARRLAAALRQPIGRFPGIERRYDLRSFTADLRVFEGRSDAAYRAAAIEAAANRPTSSSSSSSMRTATPRPATTPTWPLRRC
jgi:hypothetical protein